MKRIIISISLLCICITTFAQKEIAKVYSDRSPHTGGVMLPDVCILYKSQYFHCYTFFSQQNKDSIECLTCCRPVDVSDFGPKHKPIGDNIRTEKIKLNKRGRGKTNFKLEATYFLREPQWEEKAVYLNVSYDINTKNGKKSTVSYYFTEKADKN